MMTTDTFQPPRTDLPVRVETTDTGVLVRWDGGEVILEGDADQQRRYIEAMSFCYAAGFEEANNPRLFVP